jgi:hypothetical protein
MRFKDRTGADPDSAGFWANCSKPPLRPRGISMLLLKASDGCLCCPQATQGQPFAEATRGYYGQTNVIAVLESRAGAQSCRASCDARQLRATRAFPSSTRAARRADEEAKLDSDHLALIHRRYSAPEPRRAQAGEGGCSASLLASTVLTGLLADDASRHFPLAIGAFKPTVAFPPCAIACGTCLYGCGDATQVEYSTFEIDRFVVAGGCAGGYRGSREHEDSECSGSSE